MISNDQKRLAAAGVLLSLTLGGLGCELVADFDRTKIDAGLPTVDSGVHDQTSPPVPDTGVLPDVTTDAAPDVQPTVDAGDAGDAQPDVRDTGAPEAGPDASDSGPDVVA